MDRSAGVTGGGPALVVDGAELVVVLGREADQLEQVGARDRVRVLASLLRAPSEMGVQGDPLAPQAWPPEAWYHADPSEMGARSDPLPPQTLPRKAWYHPEPSEMGWDPGPCLNFLVFF